MKPETAVEEREPVEHEEVVERDSTVEANKSFMEVTVHDDALNKDVTGNIPYVKSTFLRTDWVADMHTTMEFKNYDEVSVWALPTRSGDVYLEKNEEEPVPKEMYDKVLEYLSIKTGKDMSGYRITSIKWSGAPVASVRTADIYGVSAHTIVTDTFEGKIELEKIERITYSPVYLETEESYRVSRKGIATAVYELQPEEEEPAKEKSFLEQIGDFIKSTAGMVAIGLLLLLLFIFVVLFIIIKRNKKDKNGENGGKSKKA